MKKKIVLHVQHAFGAMFEVLTTTRAHMKNIRAEQTKVHSPYFV